VYHEQYDLHLGDHVFPAKKYRWLRDRSIRTGFAAPGDFAVPARASAEDLLLVHELQWVSKLKSGLLIYDDILRLEIPYSQQMVEAFCLAAGGYARNVEDTVTIHANTAAVAKEVMEKVGTPRP
jgi:acetoin utilization deacetylase AcuC-like enzyme